jgi:GNAT superfamily N-acetyltransferase
MDIERAGEDDLNAVVALLAAQFGEHDIGLGLDVLRTATAGLLAEARRGVVLLAKDSARVGPVGLAVLAYTWTLEHGGLVAWLEELYVVPDRRGHGVGRALLRRALDVARESGCRAVDLEVDREHARAERLYEREGFAVLARRRWTRALV